MGAIRTGRDLFSPLRPGFLIVAAIALFVVLGPSHAWAGHGMNEGADCYDCHDLKGYHVGDGRRAEHVLAQRHQQKHE